MASKWSYVLAAALLTLAGSAAGGCNLVLGIHDLSDGGAGGGQACDTDLQCQINGPCVASTCTKGTCADVPLPDGDAPESTQIPGDCKVIACLGGVAEQHHDDQDLDDDGEPCTVDTCNGGNPVHTAKPDMAACSVGENQGLCSGGKCQILCVSDAACDDKNPCTQDSCDKTKSICVFTPLDGVNTPGAAQTDFDCNVQACVAGVDTKVPDDSDLPKTATDCDQELCTNGVPSNPPLDLDISCGPAKDMFCDGAGACGQCNAPTQCPGVDDDCQARSCTNHVCGITYTPVGTPRSAAFQTPGDCNVVVCDGAGNSAAQPKADDTDLPVDGNKCTMDVCTNGVASHPFEAANTACGNNSACNATGQCGCANDAACVAPNTCGGGNPGTPFVCGCTKKTCAVLGKTCGMVTDGCFAMQNCSDNAKNGTETDVDCGGNGTCAALCAQGKQCNVDADCGTGHCSDGVCCNTACTGTCQACTAAKKGGGLDGTCGNIAINLPDTSATVTCTGTSSCDGNGNCKKNVGQTCAGAAQCVNGNCADGVCCGVASCLACQSCALGGGACANVPAGMQDTTFPGVCQGNNACDGAGTCKKTNGFFCAQGSDCVSGNCADNVCCNTTCDSSKTCMSCNGASPGTCSMVTSADDPDSCSAGTSTCSSAGACLLKSGQPCFMNAACASGFCIGMACL